MTIRQFLCGAAIVTMAALPLYAAGSDMADAAMRSDTAAVRALIAKKVDVNAAQVDGSTALHWAVHRDNAEMVEILVKAGAKAAATNRLGTTPLAMAALYGNPRIVDALLKGGADVKAVGVNGETMLMLAARNGNPEVIRLLVAAGADVNARETVRGTTALMWAAEQRHPEAVKALLAAGANPALRSGGAGLPRNYMAQRVNVRNVEEAQRRRQRAKEAGRTYEEQLEWENANGVNVGNTSRIPTDNNNNAAAAAAGGATPAAGAAPAQANPGGGNAAAGAGQAPGAGRAGRGGRGGGGGGQGRGRGAGAAANNATANNATAEQPEAGNDDTEVIVAGLTGTGGGGLTALTFAAREGDFESVQALVDAGADINQTTTGGWTPLLTAINNRNYRVALYLLDKGADPNIANNNFGWTPLYLATDNRNIEGGDYPVPRPDLDHMDVIKKLLEKGANPNATVRDNTLSRTIFTMQWFFEAGASAFNRAAQSSDTELMTLLLKYGADPKTRTDHGDTALTLAAGIGWVDGVTYERSAKENLEAVRMLLDLGLDPNASNSEGRTPLMGAALKGRNDVVQLLVDRGARLDARDRGSRDTHIVGASIAGHTWQALDYAEGLVRVGVQSAVSRDETAALIRKLMEERNLPVPPENRTVQSICIVDICAGIPEGK